MCHKFQRKSMSHFPIVGGTKCATYPMNGTNQNVTCPIDSRHQIIYFCKFRPPWWHDSWQLDTSPGKFTVQTFLSPLLAKLQPYRTGATFCNNTIFVYKDLLINKAEEIYSCSFNKYEGERVFLSNDLSKPPRGQSKKFYWCWT